MANWKPTTPGVDIAELRQQERDARAAERARDAQAYFSSDEYKNLLAAQEALACKHAEEKRLRDAWDAQRNQIHKTPPVVGTVMEGALVTLGTYNEKPSFQTRLLCTSPEYPALPVWRWDNRYGIRCFLNKRSTDSAIAKYIEDDKGWWRTITVAKVRIMAYGKGHAILDVVEW